MEPKKLLELLHAAERLKDTTRHCDTSKGRRESVVFPLSHSPAGRNPAGFSAKD